MDIKLNNPGDFAHIFLEQYMRGGFGSMNKTDVEILVFSLLRDYSSLNALFSQHEMSLALRIPVSKVSRLCYEAQLRYGNNDNRDQLFKDSMEPILMEAHFDVEGNRVRFAVEDKFIRLQLQAKMKEIHGFADSSFNSEVVSITISDFVDFYTKEFPVNAEKLNQAVGDALNESKDKEIKMPFAEKITAFLKKSASDGSIQVISGITLQAILKYLNLS